MVLIDFLPLKTVDKERKYMAAANNSAGRSNAKSNPSGGKNSTYSKNKSTNGRTASAKAKSNDARQKEIYVFIYLAVAIFLLCSSFGWCGVIGDFISKIIFGLFGTISYIIPIYLFLSAAFLLSNGARKDLVKRVLCVGIFLVVIAFICQLVYGASDATAKSLYTIGANDKRGGGVLLGGILVLLYKLIGLTGCIIVTALLAIIGIIIVMDVSLIAGIRKFFAKLAEDVDYDDEDDDYDDIPYNRKSQKNKNRDVLNSIKVLEPEGKKKKAKKTKNKTVNEEEVHELKPVAEDFFNKPEYNEKINKSDLFDDIPSIDADILKMTDSAFVDSAFTDDIYAENGAVEQASVKRQRKKTKETTLEMQAERDAVARSINAVSATTTVAQTTKESQPANIAPATRVVGQEYVRPGNSSRTPISQGNTTNITKTATTAANQVVNGQIEKDVVIKEYKFPPIDLLRTGKGKGGAGNDASVRETAIKLKSTLESFGVNVTISDYSQGPSVTRYELLPEQGVKVSKIVNLADDIKLNLAAADIRIEAPIPGKAAIGIEVPNKESQPVFFRDLLESENFKKFPSRLAFAVGKDISGQVIVADIAKMPHLLVAGATGSGKSVCINTLIMSILYKANPNDVKLIMIDPKQVELSVYNGIPHMLIPVVTDPKKAAGALNWAVMEMTNRYQLFAQYNVRNLQGYNEKVEKVNEEENGDEEMKKLPQIVIIVDELADLMMVAHGEVEDAIVRLSQLARAAGIHLIIATQRPSVDVITGLIKANVPSRIAMTVSSGVDSRTILDMVGAEKLLGKGDMLFYPTGYPKPVRVQGAFLTDDEIVSVVDFLKEQNGEAAVDEKITQEIDNSSSSGGAAQSGGGSDSDVDEYFVDAGKFIISKEKASIGMLQRVYKIGFNRAARIMDQLSDAGVVGPEEGTKPRKVLMTMEEFENYVEENM